MTNKNKIIFSFFIVINLFSFISCGNADVKGKLFQHEYGMTIEFDNESIKAFYINEIGTYTIDKKDVIISLPNEEIKMQYKNKSLFIYAFNEEGKQTENLVSKPFVFLGEASIFKNMLQGTEYNQNGLLIKFTENTAQVGEKSIPYKYDSDSCKYSIEGVQPTFYKNYFVKNVYNKILETFVGKKTPLITYEDAWWLNKFNSNFNDLLESYVQNYYYLEYESVEDDEFAKKRLLNSKKAELTSKVNSVNAKKEFLIVIPAIVGKYDFDNAGFSVKADLLIDEIDSTFMNDETAVELRLCKYRKDYFGSLKRTWVSDINTDVYLSIDEAKAENLDKKLGENRNVLLVIKAKPSLEGDGYWSMVRQENYILYSQVLESWFVDLDNLEYIADAKFDIRW